MSSKVNEPFFFDPEQLRAKAAKNKDEFKRADPFPHIVFDDFLPTEVANRLFDEFPRPDFKGYAQPDNAFQVNKLGRVQDTHFKGVPWFSRCLLSELNSMTFLDFLENLTRIKGVIADPHFFGGAFHQILPGGKLDVHADFNKDLKRKLERRINVLLYLNKDWKDEYGGHLELWDREMKKRVKKVAPIFNRLVIFNTSSHSFHGHPDPLNCPDGMTRKSIALYYYTVGRPKEEDRGFHATVWRKRPGEDGAFTEVEANRGIFQEVKAALKLFVPPVVDKLLSKVR